MNNKIADLLIEAMDAIPEHAEFSIPKEFTEKFAELIVKETLRVTGATPSMSKTANTYFGVE